MRIFLLFVYFSFLGLMAAACFIPRLIEMGYHTDKMLHVFVVCFALLWPCLSFQKWRSIFVFAFLIFSTSLIVELLQSLTPDRNPEWEDVLANVTGIAIGLVIGYLLRTGYYAETLSNKRS